MKGELRDVIGRIDSYDSKILYILFSFREGKGGERGERREASRLRNR